MHVRACSLCFVSFSYKLILLKFLTYSFNLIKKHVSPLFETSLIFFMLLESQWKEQIRILVQYSFLENSSFPRYSCKARCGMEQRNASLSLTTTHDKPLPRCYCDNVCDDLGDCCFDFDEL